MDKARSSAKVIKNTSFGNGPDDAILHADRKYSNNRVEGNHSALKQLAGPKHSFRQVAAAKNAPKGIETHHTIKNGYFTNSEPGVLNETAFLAALLKDAA